MSDYSVSPAGGDQKRMFGNKAWLVKGSINWKSSILARLSVVFALGTALFALPSMASATMITGTVFLGNASVLVIGNGITNGCIDFYTSGSPTTCATGAVTVPVNPFVTSGSSSNFTTGSAGTIQDLNYNMTAVTDFISITVGGTVYMFDLTDIRTNMNPANATGCTTGNTQGGTTCQPVGSPFQFINGPAGAGGTANTVGVTLTFDAIGYTGTNATATSYTGIMSTQVAGNINSVLNAVGTAGGYVTSSLSLELFPTSSVPEPATFGTLGASLLGLSFLVRKRIKNS